MADRRTRYYSLPCDFFTNPETTGLSPLAACLLLRARTESLIGVLTRSPRMLGAPHRIAADTVEVALAELVARDLVAWWPEHELLVEVGGAFRAQGSAEKAAQAQVDSLPPFARDVAMRRPTPPVAPPVQQCLIGGVSGEVEPPGGPNARTHTPSDTHTPSQHVPKSRKRRGPVPEWAPPLVLAELIAACRVVGGPTAGPRHAVDHPAFLDNLAKLHAECEPTAEEWRAVIAHRLAMTQRGEGFGHLTIDSLCAPKNFRRWLADSQIATRATGSRSGPAAPSARPTERSSFTLSDDEVEP